jgi:parallel beta-helix repeat protein
MKHGIQIFVALFICLLAVNTVYAVCDPYPSHPSPGFCEGSWIENVTLCPSDCLVSVEVSDDPQNCAKDTTTASNYGIWNSSSRTCKLKTDITGTVRITAQDIIFDCKGHSITGSGGSDGIFVIGKNEVTIRNCNVSGFVNGIYMEKSKKGSSAKVSSIIGNTVTGNASQGIYLFESDWVEITHNDANNNADWGIAADRSDHITVVGNHANNNGARGIHFQGKG